MDDDEPEKKDIDAFFALLTKIEQTPKALDAELTKLIEFLISEKDKFLPKLTSSKEDQDFFDNELEILNKVRHSSRLMDATVTDTALKAEIWETVVAVFVAGINLGQYSEPISLVKKELQSLKARDMGMANKADNNPGIKARRNLLIAQEYDLEEMAVSRKECVAIEKDFTKICKDHNEKAAKTGEQEVAIAASAQTLQRDARAIIELRHKT